MGSISRYEQRLQRNKSFFSKVDLEVDMMDDGWPALQELMFVAKLEKHGHSTDLSSDPLAVEVILREIGNEIGLFFGLKFSMQELSLKLEQLRVRSHFFWEWCRIPGTHYDAGLCETFTDNEYWSHVNEQDEYPLYKHFRLDSVEVDVNLFRIFGGPGVALMDTWFKNRKFNRPGFVVVEREVESTVRETIIRRNNKQILPGSDAAGSSGGSITHSKYIRPGQRSVDYPRLAWKEKAKGCDDLPDLQEMLHHALLPYVHGTCIPNTDCDAKIDVVPSESFDWVLEKFRRQPGAWGSKTLARTHGYA